MIQYITPNPVSGVHSGSTYLTDKPLLFPLIGRNLYLIHMRYVLTDVRFIHIILFYLEFVGRRRNVWCLGGGAAMHISIPPHVVNELLSDIAHVYL